MKIRCRARKLLPSGLAGLLGVMALFMAGCNLPDPFAPYNGVNLIAPQGFNSGQWGVIYSPPVVTGTWQYLTFTAATASTTTGLPDANAPVYRLEIPNLVPNGDFEDTTAQVNNWTLKGSGATESWVNTAGVAIDGYSLHFTLSGASTTPDYIDYQIAGGTTPLQDGPVANARYRFLFDYAVENTSPAVFDLNNGTISLLPETDKWSIDTPGSTFADVLHFPPDTVNPEVVLGSQTPIYFSIGQMTGTAHAEDGVIDNFRVTRTDIDDYLHLGVPYGSNTRANLISGTYEFSVWVKLEDAANVTPSTPNAYNADGITLGINTARTAYSVGDLNLTSSSWTKVSMKAFAQIDTSLASSATALDLYLSPTNINSKDVGRLLVSTPTLTYLPNG